MKTWKNALALRLSEQWLSVEKKYISTRSNTNSRGSWNPAASGGCYK